LEEKLSIHEECGVFGIFDRGDNLDVARLAYYAICALQHRGQESCGISVNYKDENGKITVLQHKDLGLVREVFKEDTISGMKGFSAVGHVRYSTTGETSRENAQPIVSKYKKGTFSMAHNGNISNAKKLRKELENLGSTFMTDTDSEIISNLIAKERVNCHSTVNAVLEVMKVLEGAYSLIVSTPQKLIAIRDPNGFRPLCIGKIGNSYVFASESCALNSINATYLRDVLPGEVVVCDKDGITSVRDMCGVIDPSFCVFEYIYFARPDSFINGLSVYEIRQNAGRILARENPVDADVVVGVPDSGLDAALGYAVESGIKFGFGFIKNKYVGRTFIEPTQNSRENALRIKLNVMKAEIVGKRVIMVDDSIVRGTTSKRIVKLLYEAGAKEVHVRISFPPVMNPCFFGTDIPSRDDLIACKMSLDEMKDYIGADSLSFISLDGLSKILNFKNPTKIACNEEIPITFINRQTPKINADKSCKKCSGLCTACVSGIYPVEKEN
jgi:amidophosphoribosyltransferase